MLSLRLNAGPRRAARQVRLGRTGWRCLRVGIAGWIGIAGWLGTASGPAFAEPPVVRGTPIDMPPASGTPVEKASDRPLPIVQGGQRPLRLAVPQQSRERLSAPTGAYFPSFYSMPADEVGGSDAVVAPPAPRAVGSAVTQPPLPVGHSLDVEAGGTPNAAQPSRPQMVRGSAIPLAPPSDEPLVLPTTSVTQTDAAVLPPALPLPASAPVMTGHSLGPGQILSPVAVPHPSVAPFASRVQKLPIHEQAHGLALDQTIPADFSPWWLDPVREPLRGGTTLPVDVSDLVIAALAHSPTVTAIELEPAIRRTALVEEDAAFDWGGFVETTYDDINEPVGNTLTTGGPGRFKDRNAIGSTGFRKQTRSGGEAEISQQVGWQTTNSRFFIPDEQGNSRLALSFTQPLLAKNGKAYNNSRIVLARLDGQMADQEAQEKLQQHLLDVATAYWDLYRARAVYLQRMRVLAKAEAILAKLEGRQQVDALPRQVLRARAAVSARRTEIVRATTEIRNAEAVLRRLVADPRLVSDPSLELLPAEDPGVCQIPVSLAASARTAMMQRPEIRRAVGDVRSAGVRLGMACNELMPRLDFVFNTYISGLRGEGNVFRSLEQSWTTGRPSFAGGLLFEMPVGNRAAKARHHRRELEMLQATRQLEATVETTLTEVELAVREAETTYREMVSQYQTLQATSDEAAYLADRWQLLPGNDRGSTILLEDLLDAQSRAADDEAALVTAQVNYLLALTNLRRTMGTLMQAGPTMSANCREGLDCRD